MKYNVYPCYKDSEVEWIGEIPAHWEVSKAKRFLMPGNNGMKIGPFGSQLKLDSMVDKGYKIYGQENVIKNNFSLGNKYIPKQRYKELSAYEIFPGDIVVSMMGTTGKCKVVPKGIEKGIMDSHLLRMRSDSSKMTPEFLSLIINDSYYIFYDLMKHSKGAIMTGLNSSIIRSLMVLCPSIPEQNDIVNFVTRESNKIDEIIIKYGKLVEILKEKNSTLISCATTKGIESGVEMKDSEVEWIGEIPAHWEVSKAKKLFKEINNRSNKDNENLLSVSHITGVTLRSEKPEITMFLAESTEGYKKCEEGDLVINTMWAWMGALGFTDQIGVVSPSYNVYRFKKTDLLPNYYDQLFRSPPFVSEIKRWSKGIWTSRLRLYPKEFFRINLPVPPKNEQKRISKLIEHETLKTNDLINKIEKATSLLKERRKSLINCVVTGKIDVSGG